LTVSSCQECGPNDVEVMMNDNIGDFVYYTSVTGLCSVSSESNNYNLSCDLEIAGSN